MQKLTALFLIVILAACGGGNDASSDAGSRSASDFQGRFTVTDTRGHSFDSDSPRARINFVVDDLIDVGADGQQVRAAANGLPETGPGRTTELNQSNVMYTAKVMIDGKMTRVGCDPDNPVNGWFERTELTDTTISGAYEFEVVRCGDYYSDAEIDVTDLPFTVRVEFEDLPLGNL